MKSSGKKVDPPQPAAPKPTPTPTSSDIQEARKRERDRVKRMRGRASTILTTGSLGEAPIGKKTLLG